MAYLLTNKRYSQPQVYFYHPYRFILNIFVEKDFFIQENIKVMMEPVTPAEKRMNIPPILLIVNFCES